MFKNNVISILKTLLFILTLIFLTITDCSPTKEPLYYIKPNYQIAKELFNRKVIMLGEAAHSTSNYKRRLLNILENWLIICYEKAKNINLTLVIETDAKRISSLNNYLSTGNLKNYLDETSPFCSLQDLEYIQLLKRFNHKVDAYNQSHHNKLFFKVVGFEPTEDSAYYNDLARRPQRDFELWFVNERDSIVAQKIVEYSQNNPGEQILIYYGMAHLQNGLVNKLEESKVLSEKESMGYFLAYYLKQQFGESSVSTFCPINCLASDLRYTKDSLHLIFKEQPLEQIRNQEFAFKPRELVHPIYWDTTFDYIINMHENPEFPMYLNYVCSRYIFEKTIENINRVKSSLPGNKAGNEINRYFKGIKLLTGYDFDNDTVINNWVSNYTFDGLDWLYNDKLTDSIKTWIFKTNDKYSINSIIRLYGISIPDSINITDNGWIQNKLPKILEQIKFTNSIGIYWIGYPDEKIKAKEFLIKYSGEDYPEPDMYLNWYLKKYANSSD